MTWGIALFRDTEEEQRQWMRLHAEGDRRQQAKNRMSPEIANRVAKITKRYPWVTPGLALGLAGSNASDKVVADAAAAMARQKGHHSRWSQIGDVVAGPVKSVAHAVGTGVGDVAQGFKTLAGGAAGGVSPQGAGRPQSREQAAGAASLEQVYDSAKGATRAASAAAQSGYEAVVGEVRSSIKHGEGPMGGGALGVRTPERNIEVAKQTTLGAGVLDEKPGIDLGTGFFAAGEAAKEQARNARTTLSVDGHAWTPGRAVASAVVEPGTLPYKLLSGTVDAAAAWYGDPAAHLGKASAEAKAAKRTLSAVEGEAQLARAAEKASPEWRAVVEEARGMVGGTRPTVVPRVVDKYLYSDEWKAIAEKIAETRSPTEIWRAFDKKMPPELAQQLAGLTDAGEVTKLMRPHLGLEVMPPQAGLVGRLLGGDEIGPLGMRVTQNLQSRYRPFNVMPDTFLPFEDPDTFIRNLDNSLANAKVMGEERRAILDQAFHAFADESPGKHKRLLDVAADAVQKSLVSHGVDEETAARLSSWTQDSEKIRHYLTDDLGHDINFSWVEEGAGPKPAALIDMLHSGTHLYDPAAVREIRSLTRTVKLLNNPAFQVPLSVIDAVQQELWKPLATMRAAYFARVNGEEVVRSLGSGAFDSAWDYLNFAAFGRGKGTARGGLQNVLKEADDIVERLGSSTLDDATRSGLEARLTEINDEVNRGKTAYQDAMVGKAWKHDSFARTERSLVRSGNWAVVDKNGGRAAEFRWRQGLADETIAMAQDPIIKRVAHGGVLPGDKVPNPRLGLDGIKDWLRDGAGRTFRKKFEDAYPGVDFTSETALDEVIEKAQMRLSKLGENRDLIDAVATGKLGGKALAYENTTGPRSASKELLDRLEEWRLDPASPRFQKYEQAAEEVQRGAQRPMAKALAARDQAVQWFYGTLYGQASDKLARSPVFRAQYWDRMEQLMPYLDEASRAEALANAEEWGKLSKGRLQRLAERAKTPPGEVPLEQADKLAKGWALDKTKELLFDSAERSQFFDATRAVFPFGEAWKEVLGRWGKLATERPQIPRRFEQIVRGARGAGFFHTDPATGQEVFSYPMPGPVADYLGIGVEGSVQGLSLGTSVIPGVGPVASLTMKKILPDVPETDLLRKILFPYGEPQSVAGAFLPSYFSKAVAALQGDEGTRIYANSYFEVMRQLVASGDYGSSREEKQRLLDDARDRARVITGVRALAQFFAPSAPVISYKAPVKGGDQIAGLLVKDFAKMMEDEDKGKIDSAVGEFTEKYGDQAYAYMIGKTKSQVGGQKASVAYGDWERRNRGFIRKYGEVAGYFGPQEEGFDSTVFQRQVNNAGKRTYRTASQAIDDAQSVVGGWVYRSIQERMPANPSDKQRQWLASAKEAIQKEYPGWRPEAQPHNLAKNIDLLREASQDDDVKDTSIGKGLRAYFEARQMVIDHAKKRGVAGWYSANATENLRTWLRQAGDAIAQEYPGFRGVWTDLLSREMQDEEKAA